MFLLIDIIYILCWNQVLMFLLDFEESGTGVW